MAGKPTSLDIDREVTQLWLAREQGERLTPGESMIVDSWPSARSATVPEVAKLEKTLKEKAARDAHTLKDRVTHWKHLMTGEYRRQAQELADKQSLSTYMQMMVIADNLDVAARGARTRDDLIRARNMTFNRMALQDMYQAKMQHMAGQALAEKAAASAGNSPIPPKRLR